MSRDARDFAAVACGSDCCPATARPGMTTAAARQRKVTIVWIIACGMSNSAASEPSWQDRTLLHRLIPWGGAAAVAALAALAISEAPLGTPLFFLLAAVPCVVYGLLMRRLLSGSDPELRVDAAPGRTGSDPGRLLLVALLFAVAFRVPLVVRPVGADNDM